MSAVPQFKKEFVLKHVFANVPSFKEEVHNYSYWEDHFNVAWCMNVVRLNNCLAFYVYCDPIAPSDKWTIRTRIEFKAVGSNQNDIIKTMDFCYEKTTGYGCPDFLEWEKMEKEYLVDGKLAVEAKVTIIETTGLGKEKIREFDESQKDVSDCVLVARGTKFYVSKMYLASQSSFFKSLLIENSTISIIFNSLLNWKNSESKKSEVVLKNVDPNDFHYFLEVLYGEVAAVDDSNVEGVLLLADRLDSPIVKKICEEFLLEKSKMSFETKQQLADRYQMENWNLTLAVPQLNKEFVLKHVFKDVTGFQEGVPNFNKWENHFNMNWCMSVRRLSNYLAIHVWCEPMAPSDKWSIQTRIELKAVGRNQNDITRTKDCCYEKRERWGFPNFLEWEKMEKGYLVDGNLTVEATVTISETSGLGKEKIREFDESQKDVSDCILVARGTKFYVSRMYLASQSSFFKSVFIENSKVSKIFNSFLNWNNSESKKSEVVLKNVDPNDFHYFLEVLYGEVAAVDDSNVEGVLLLSDRLDSPIVKRICEEFLLEKSKKSFTAKQQLADRYQMENWNQTLAVPQLNKEFVLKHVFKDVTGFQNGVPNYSKSEAHFNVNWYIIVGRLNNHLAFHIQCNPMGPSGKWSIQTRLEFKVVGPNRNDVTNTMDYCYENNEGFGSVDFLKWEKMENEYLVNGSLTVKAKVTIIGTTGLGKEKIRKFDESRKAVSDVVLVVRSTKFYLSKMYLAAQSSYFNSLLIGNSSETKNPEIVLKDVDPNGFHYFLEVLYVEPAIDDDNVEEVLLLANKFDTPTVKRRCEEFLIQKSKKSFKAKQQLADLYQLDNWKFSNANSKTKQFKLKNVFKDAMNFEEGVDHYSDLEDHFNVNWYMCVNRFNNHLAFFVYCEPLAPSDKWSIQTEIEFKVVGRNQNDVNINWYYCYKTIGPIGFPDVLEWGKMGREYIVDGNLTVEATVTIIETTGLGKKKIRKFDESRKDVSDVVLIVQSTKFYLSKMYLASQSSVFKSLFIGNSSESKKPAVVLKGVDPNDFHDFLEVLYGESAIDDANVEGVLFLADKFDTPTTKRRCEEFLLKESRKSFDTKQLLADRYHLRNWHAKWVFSNANNRVKQVKLNHVFKDASSFEEGEYFSEWEHLFNVEWGMSAQRLNNNLHLSVHCEPIAPPDEWSIQTKLEFKVVGRNYHLVLETDYCYESNISREFDILGWQELENEYLVDGNLTVEANVTIIETIGLGKEKIRKFDESQKHVADAILVVRDTKFYVAKAYLINQSMFFVTFFLGNFSESKKSKFTLKGVDPNDFHYFLEVVYGETAIDDSTIEGILMVADKYSAETVVEKCQEKCMSEINTVDAVKSIFSDGVYDLDQSIMSELLEKFRSFNNQ